MTFPKRFLFPLALTAMAALPASVLAVDFIGHRGASFDAPENTVASVRLAFEQGADASEIDIYLTKDKRIIALHDKTTKKTTGVEWKPGEHTLAELSTLDAGSWKDKKFTGEPIPTLEALLDVIPPGKKLVIEVKSGPEILPYLQKILEASPKYPEQIVIIAFDWDNITGAKQRFRKVPCYWLYGKTPHVDKKTGAISDRPNELLARTTAAGLDGLDIHYESEITPQFISRVKDAGQELLVWTVNDPVAARRLADLGVAGITTDRPGWLREQVETTGQ